MQKYYALIRKKNACTFCLLCPLHCIKKNVFFLKIYLIMSLSIFACTHAHELARAHTHFTQHLLPYVLLSFSTLHPTSVIFLDEISEAIQSLKIDLLLFCCWFLLCSKTFCRFFKSRRFFLSCVKNDYGSRRDKVSIKLCSYKDKTTDN